MRKYFFGWDNLKKVFVELYATLSNDKTFLSSKRIERLVLFWAAVLIATCYVFYNRADIATIEIISICTMLFGYAGFNTVMGNKDKKDDKASAQVDKVIEEKIDDKNQPTNTPTP